MTGKEYDDWLARLRDPSSKQTHGSMRDYATEARCAVGYAIPDPIFFGPFMARYDWIKANVPSFKKIVELNDLDYWSLPSIAIWIETNIPRPT